LENDVSDEEKPNDGEGNETSCDSLIFSSSKEEKNTDLFYQIFARYTVKNTYITVTPVWLPMISNTSS